MTFKQYNSCAQSMNRFIHGTQFASETLLTGIHSRLGSKEQSEVQVLGRPVSVWKLFRLFHVIIVRVSSTVCLPWHCGEAR